MCTEIVGTGDMSSASAAVPVDGAVCGLPIDVRSRRPPFSLSLFGWIEGNFRRRRCSHCFADSCLLAHAVDVFLVVGTGMLIGVGGTVCEELVHCVIHGDKGDANEAVVRSAKVGKQAMPSIVNGGGGTPLTFYCRCSEGEDGMRPSCSKHHQVAVTSGSKLGKHPRD